jgi:hypothetical protein
MLNIKTKVYKEKQIIDEQYLLSEAPEILKCYNHFKERYESRFGTTMTYNDYWIYWVSYLVGEFLYTKGTRMVRNLGHYIKDDRMFEIVYTKLKFGFYIPLTLYEITKKSKQNKNYRIIIKNKKINNMNNEIKSFENPEQIIPLVDYNVDEIQDILVASDSDRLTELLSNKFTVTEMNEIKKLLKKEYGSLIKIQCIKPQTSD